MSSEAITLRVVLLFGAAADAEASTALAAESSQVALLLKDAAGLVDFSVISLGLARTVAGTSGQVRLDESGRSLTDRLLAAAGAFALRTRFTTFPMGRLLNSLGPVDPGRVFWRTMRGHPEAMRLLKSANVVIATDSATTKAAWLAVHRGWVDEAFFDHRSASVGISLQLPTAGKSPHD